jgi:murein DD-endopeptidase MepM/ murein hydrolase activator NlpD
VSSLGLKSPLASTSVLYGFGLRTLNGVTDNHTGLDLAASQGTTVMAAGSGTVTFAGWHSYGGGNRIEITHSNGVVTTYNHLSAINVTVGQTVTAGQAIGAVGATGNASGPHLHFEVLQNGAWTNPAVWLGLS